MKRENSTVLEKIRNLLVPNIPDDNFKSLMFLFRTAISKSVSLTVENVTNRLIFLGVNLTLVVGDQSTCYNAPQNVSRKTFTMPPTIKSTNDYTHNSAVPGKELCSGATTFEPQQSF